MYQLTATSDILRTEDAAHIPADPANCDYAKYLQWVAGGGVPQPYSIEVPQQVTRKQARKALAMAGLLNLVQPAIDAIADPQARQLAQIDWDDSTTFERDNTTLLQLAQALSLSAEQVDQLFISAARL